MEQHEIQWDTGRAVIQFEGEMGLSIITPERNDYLRDEMSNTPSGMLGLGGWAEPDALADGTTTWEIAFIQADGYGWPETIDEFQQYAQDDGEGWIIYANVPIEKVMEYINDHNGVQTG